MNFRFLPEILTTSFVAFALFGLPGVRSAVAQEFVANYDEAQVPDYELPELVTQRLRDSSDPGTAWSARRAELLEQFSQQMYGFQPTGPFDLKCERFESGPSLNGRALRQQFKVTLTTAAGSHSIDLLVFTPAKSEQPVPCFLGLSFYGNHTVASDPEIAITQAWCRPTKDKGVIDNRATEAGRGTSVSRWPLEMIIEAGFGIATCYCGDIDPDFHDEFRNGVHPLFPDELPGAEQPDRWGTISAWAWGLSRMLDCLQSDVPEVDGNRVVVIGHSRLGKTALWAGATDERFAGAISNNSGCGGAALSRRAFGETVQRINDSFPHWFCGNFKKYNLNEAELPVDQHQLVALMAPRPVYVASATEDQWADPRGEFLAAKLAREAYQLLELDVPEFTEMPQPNTAILGRVSYHLREGKHDINAWDWANYIRFMQLIEK